jgi:thioredoxin-like negative regulator of GroEL
MSYNFSYLNNLDEFNKALNENEAMLVYFNSNSCNVGEAIAPKVMNLIEEKFSKIQFYFVDREMSPEIAAQHSVFVEPTILVFFAGRETIRKSRHFSIDELEMSIERPYSIIF